MFHDAESPLGLDRPVHSKKCTVDAFQVFDDLSMHRGEFPVNSNGSVSFRLFTLLCERTAGTVLTLIDFFLSAVSIAFYALPVPEDECFPVRASHRSFFVYRKVFCAETRRGSVP